MVPFASLRVRVAGLLHDDDTGEGSEGVDMGGVDMGAIGTKGPNVIVFSGAEKGVDRGRMASPDWLACVASLVKKLPSEG